MNEVAKFSDTESLPFILVMEGKGTVSTEQQARRRSSSRPLPALTLDLPGEPQLSTYLTETPKVAVPSQDGAALLLIVPMNAVTSAETIGDTSPLFAAADTLRAAAKADLAPSGLTAYVTGPGGVIADFVTAFARDRRHPARRRARRGLPHPAHRLPQPDPAVRRPAHRGLRPRRCRARRSSRWRKNDVIGLSGQSQGILSILVVGAATDYALLLVSRYKEELHDDAEHLGGDEEGLARRGRADRRQRRHRHPRPAVPPALRPRQHLRTGTGRRPRHRRRPAWPP